MRNPCLATVLAELVCAGVRYSLSQRRRHVQVRWSVNGHGPRTMVVPGTAGDWRSERNCRAEVRRKLRADGLLAPTTRHHGGAPGAEAGANITHVQPSAARRAAKTNGSNGELNMSDDMAWRSGRAKRAPPTTTATTDMATTLELLATRVAKLSPSWRDPEQFASERSEIAHCLRRLARGR
jgi:hypothetical protein